MIVGNNMGDMQFGRNAEMFTIYVRTTNPDIAMPNPLIDLCFNNLYEFSNAVQSAKEN